MAVADKLKEGEIWKRNCAKVINDLQSSVFQGGTLPVVLVGASTTYAKCGGVLYEKFSDTGSSGTSETDLASYTLPASSLGTNGDKLEAEFGVSLVNSTSTKRVKLKLAGTTIFDTGALTLSASGSLVLYSTIIRDSSTSVRYSTAVNTTAASTATYANVGALTGLTLSNTNVLKITGTSAGVGSADNDLVCTMARLLWFPAA